MAPQTETEIILYDLACTKNTCFSPVVWRIRLILNYKNIPYKTVFLEFPDIEPTLKELWVTWSSSCVTLEASASVVPSVFFVPCIRSEKVPGMLSVGTPSPPPTTEETI